MGRHAGFLTAASVMARQNPEDGPHLIYVPEVAFDENKFLEDVDRVYSKQGRCLIAVLENGQQADGSVLLPQTLHQWLGGKTRISAEGVLE